MATLENLRQRVGEDLALVPIGQDLESQDQARISATYGEVYARLKELGIATWISTGDIPEKAVPYVALLMEEKLLTTYSVPDARYQRIKADAGQDGMAAISALAEMVVPDYDSTSSESDF